MSRPFFTFRQWYIPDRMAEGIQLYLEHGICTGSFLGSVFQNNFVNAALCADDENLTNLQAYAAWLYAEAPANCWGSPEKFEAWKKRHEESRRVALI